MSRYSSIASSSSRSVTKCSWLRSSRRSSPDSLTISMRAVSGCDRISDEIDVSVLNRKCGLIWLASASSRAAISSFSCSCSRCSIRALFQILIGIATHSTVASSTAAHSARGRRRDTNSRCAATGMPTAWRDDLEPDRRRQQDDDPVDLKRRTSRQTWRWSSVKKNGEKCQIASFGQISRRPPPAKPHPTAKGSATHSPARAAGMPDHDADDRAGVGAGEQAGEEGARERQVGGVVVEEQPRRRRRPSTARRGWPRRPAVPASRASR